MSVITIYTTDKGTNMSLRTELFWVIIHWVVVIPHKSSVLSYFAAEAWNHAKHEPELSMTIIKINLKNATKIYSTVAAWF